MFRTDIHIRDPFILPLPARQAYCMFGTTGGEVDGGRASGFDCYLTEDLDEFTGPYPAFRPPADFWADIKFWAPEVHFWQGRYYMFATFARVEGDGHEKRGTGALVSDNPEGPYTPTSNGPLTPADWDCLDGTLYVDKDGAPWMVFCHEWAQITDGTICATRLSGDLTAAVGDTVTLFRASDAPWTRTLPIPGRENDGIYVTDGPFLFTAKDGQLAMLWSSFVEGGQYAIGVARAADNRVDGRWVHDKEPVYSRDGGHGMLFYTYSGLRMLSIHAPNSLGVERPIFIPVDL